MDFSDLEKKYKKGGCISVTLILGIIFLIFLFEDKLTFICFSLFIIMFYSMSIAMSIEYYGEIMKRIYSNKKGK